MNDDFPRLRAAAEAKAANREPSHDFLHVLRVTENARRIGAAEGADLGVVLPAALLHELFNYPKGHPDSHLSGERCAEEAAALLRAEGFEPARIDAIAYCIRVHPFSRGIRPETLEGRVLQDADRLDSIGAIGVARCFATTADMRRPFYDPADPFCRARAPDDKLWGLDHFYRKLLKIPEGLYTPTARAMAAERARFLEAFLAQLASEIGATAH
jgi:uncharacterized protein